MRIDSETFETALHECRHASFAAHCGMTIHEVYVAAAKGHTIVTLPFQCYQIKERWRQDPAGTMQRMVSTIGMIIAPIAAESEGARFPERCGDSDRLGQYARWWGWLPPSAGRTPTPWLTLLARARADVWRWATAPGAEFAQLEMAHHLARAGTVDSEGWQCLWSQSWARPLHQAPPAGATPRTARPRVQAAVVKPKPRMRDAPMGIWDTAWFDAHRTPPVSRAPARAVEVVPVPSMYDWRTGFVPGFFGIVA